MSSDFQAILCLTEYPLIKNLVFDMNRVKKILLYVVRYPGYLSFGFASMLLYAAFSGVSITLAIPLFDDVFVRNKEIDQIYTTTSTFFKEISSWMFCV